MQMTFNSTVLYFIVTISIAAHTIFIHKPPLCAAKVKEVLNHAVLRNRRGKGSQLCLKRVGHVSKEPQEKGLGHYPGSGDVWTARASCGPCHQHRSHARPEVPPLFPARHAPRARRRSLRINEVSLWDSGCSTDSRLALPLPANRLCREQRPPRKPSSNIRFERSLLTSLFNIPLQTQGLLRDDLFKKQRQCSRKLEGTQKYSLLINNKPNILYLGYNPGSFWLELSDIWTVTELLSL